jgi:choice-of-anchor C domain-containing protein
MVASVVLTSTVFAFGGAVNGNFEDGSYGGGGFVTLGAGNTSLTGWTITTGSVDWVDVSYWQPQAGTKSVDLNGEVPGGVSQTLATTIGNTYVVEFFLSGNPEGPPTLKALTVAATGAAPAMFSYDTAISGTTNDEMQWSPRGYSFVATSNATTLAFTSNTIDSPFGPAIDTVVVTETMPTGAQCKNGGWTSMIDRFGNGFKNQGDCVSYYASGGRNPGSIEP